MGHVRKKLRAHGIVLRRAALLVVALAAAALAPGGRAALAQEPVLYGGHFTDRRLYQLDTATGAATAGPVLSGAVQLRDLASDTRALSFRLWGVSTTTNELYRVDPATGAVTIVGAFATPQGMRALAFDPSAGVLYGVTDQPAQPGNGPLGLLYRIDPTTAAVTQIGGVSSVISGLGMDAAGRLFATPASGDDLLRIDTATGAATRVGDLGFGGFSDLAFHPADGRLFGATYSQGLFVIDPLSGAATKLGDYAAAPSISVMSGLAFGAVPEPATASLLSAALAMGLLRRRRRGIQR